MGRRACYVRITSCANALDRAQACGYTAINAARDAGNYASLQWMQMGTVKPVTVDVWLLKTGATEPRPGEKPTVSLRCQTWTEIERFAQGFDAGRAASK